MNKSGTQNLLQNKFIHFQYTIMDKFTNQTACLVALFHCQTHDYDLFHRDLKKLQKQASATT